MTTLFQVDSETGTLRVSGSGAGGRAPLDRETAEEFVLTVAATDNPDGSGGQVQYCASRCDQPD